MHSTRPTILLVEDHPDSREMFKLLLEGQGYRILEAGTGAEAFELARKTQPDLIVTDLGLPDINGIELIRRLRNLGGVFIQVPIIMFSAFQGPEYHESALQAGCTAFLTKPTDLFELESLISKLLQDHTNNEEYQRTIG